MNGKLAAARDRVRFFCAEQTVNFYIGMALAVLLLLNLRTIVPMAIGMSLCPIGTAILYLFLRALVQPVKEWKNDSDVGRSALAALIGGLYAVILTLI